jgi:hypothetical protein
MTVASQSNIKFHPSAADDVCDLDALIEAMLDAH